MSTDLTNEEQPQGLTNWEAPTELAANSAMPAHLQGDTSGTEALKDSVQPPLLKLCQGMSGVEIIEALGLGTAYIHPTMELVAKRDEVFYAIPVHFEKQYIRWAPRDSSETILEVTTDPKSELAALCQSGKVRKEGVPSLTGSGVDSCRTHLNFALLLRTAGGQQAVAAVSFAGAEYKAGSRLATAIFMKQAAVYAQLFTCSIHSRKNSQGEWYGFNFGTPVWTPESLVNECRGLYESFTSSGVDYANAAGDGSSDGASTPSEEDVSKF